jgi:hypothetical protein
LLPRLLPPSLANPILTLLTTTLGMTRTLHTHLSPLFTRLITQPDVATILALLAIFFISLKILDMMYRAVMFWINMAIRLVFWGSIVVLGSEAWKASSRISAAWWSIGAASTRNLAVRSRAIASRRRARSI